MQVVDDVLSGLSNELLKLVFAVLLSVDKSQGHCSLRFFCKSIANICEISIALFKHLNDVLNSDYHSTSHSFISQIFDKSRKNSECFPLHSGRIDADFGDQKLF